MTTEAGQEVQDVAVPDVEIKVQTIAPSQPPPSFVELRELGDNGSYARWAVGLMRDDGVVQIVVWSEDGETDRWQPVDDWRLGTFPFLTNHDDGGETYRDGFGEWSREGNEVTLLLPCGDTVYLGWPRVRAFERLIERLPVADYDASIPAAYDERRSG